MNTSLSLRGASAFSLSLLFMAWIMLALTTTAVAQKTPFRVVGYYAGVTIPVDSFETEKLSHLIYCFGGLNGNRFQLRSTTDSAIIRKMVQLKRKQPDLKVMLSLGGWGGCEHCSDVFNSAEGRKEFVQSIIDVTEYFHTDGLDLDWEYPVVKGYPGHARRPEDKHNFTMLVKELRERCGQEFELSFAAGGYTAYIDSAIAWKEIVPYVNFINIMSYDLVHGYSTVSGHHTPLYSTTEQVESTDHAVQMLIREGVPPGMLVIGAAFYGRFFRINDGSKTDLYQPARFSHGFSYKHLSDSVSAENGFDIRWDTTAQAPYAINRSKQLLATYDDRQSVALKTRYAVEHHLGGIMFWQLYDDSFRNGLLDVIYNNR